MPPEATGRPSRAGTPAYAAPGEPLASWDSWSCTQCGSRRFEAFACCDREALPVTVTVARREVPDAC